MDTLDASDVITEELARIKVNRGDPKVLSYLRALKRKADETGTIGKSVTNPPTAGTWSDFMDILINELSD